MDRLVKYLSNNSLGKEALPWGFSLLLYCYTLNKFNLVVGDGRLMSRQAARWSRLWKIEEFSSLIKLSGVEIGLREAM